MVCRVTNFPVCTLLSQEDVCQHASRTFLSFGIKILSPTTVILLAAIILSTIRMLGHVKTLCSSVGRREMLVFFHLYLWSTVLEMILVGFKYAIPKQLLLFLTTLQMSVYSAALFTLFAGCITSNMFMGIFGIRSISFLKTFVVLYLFSISTLIFLGLSSGNSILAIIPPFILNPTFFLLYDLLQLRRLKKNRGEVWAYGTLVISTICFLLSSVILFGGSQFIAFATERYFDNLFFHHFFILCSFIMVHKYWLSVYNYEVESLQLEM